MQVPDEEVDGADVGGGRKIVFGKAKVDALRALDATLADDIVASTKQRCFVRRLQALWIHRCLLARQL